MKRGFLGLSRAMCNIGVKRVSSDQFINAELTAQHVVQIDKNFPEDENKSELLYEKDIETLFHLTKPTDGGIDEIIRRTAAIETPTNVEGLRKRNVENTENSGDKNKTLVTGEEKGATQKSKSFDPIKLFGVLVPQPLRTSQQDFIQSVQICVNLANLKHQLLHLQCLYKQLLEEKKKQTSSSEEL
ncbi:coiled-coil domain-containing protein 115-like [Physella acuta]|uniref:coiled-coil domain-containing protein 115-like n=1 Tax=Physella acuta TaxID=109671 RepID=UPI0027DD799F|nr:coiled-coil domain-containing protein 115-like [Physella acuta]